MPWPKFQKFIDILVDQEVRQDVYSKLRRIYRRGTPLCAATCSEFLTRAGILAYRRDNTKQVNDALVARGWRRKGELRWLEAGAVCFSKDLTGKRMPDHVYVFLGWLDRAKSLALIQDNFSPDPHLRNMGKGVWYRGRRYSATPFDYALYPPPEKPDA
jgi:hypothetical protein